MELVLCVPPPFSLLLVVWRKVPRYSVASIYELRAFVVFVTVHHLLAFTSALCSSGDVPSSTELSSSESCKQREEEKPNKKANNRGKRGKQAALENNLHTSTQPLFSVVKMVLMSCKTFCLISRLGLLHRLFLFFQSSSMLRAIHRREHTINAKKAKSSR